MATTTETAYQSHISAYPSDDLELHQTNQSRISDIGSLHGASFEQELLPITRKTQITVLISSFFCVFMTIGLNQTYGVFQNFYISDPNSLISANERRNIALIAFVGVLGAGLTWAGSIFVNPLMARSNDLRKLTAAGALLISLGFALASLSTTTWHLLITQGLIYGVGSSLLYFPIMSIAPEYFDDHRGAAMGLILAGSGIGGLVLSPTTQYLLARVGPRWTLRVLALINLLVAGPVALATSPSRSVQRRPTLVNIAIAKRPTFILQTTGALLQAAGNFVPLTFLPDFSVALGYTTAFGALLLSLNSGVNSASRIVMGIIADKAGRQNTLIVSVLGSALSVGVLWSVAATGGTNTKALWVAFVIMYGVTSGGYNALFPTTITEVFGIQAYASVNGFAYFVRGLGAFGGTPIGGEILSREQVDGSERTAATFQTVIWYDTALLSAATVCVIGVRLFDALDKKHFKVKA
ncbi:major facilitator superfamily protein [Pseudovirgaria hyperparasitica]|uniref:Major facilitator superfamily protein n=1 Tax=Pseudovirgaria hyperparasitica TaxID=470096 RepID=A0A6A6VZ72_9PEZI|nr:major facilitator superfamily protein [Pseudovirgaria hyperparasitica]KAF2755054.1 major facilitator superfamily protein [Pseudovirgaria hyperparasitica]